MLCHLAKDIQAGYNTYLLGVNFIFFFQINTFYRIGSQVRPIYCTMTANVLYFVYIHITLKRLKKGFCFVFLSSSIGSDEFYLRNDLILLLCKYSFLLQKAKQKIFITSKTQDFKWWFWCAHSAFYISLSFRLLNEPLLGEGIDPRMALTPFRSRIGLDSNPQPSNRGWNTLTTRLDFCPSDDYRMTYYNMQRGQELKHLVFLF